MPAIYHNFKKGLVQTSSSNINPRTTSATQQYELGTLVIKRDQAYRYVKDDGTGIAAGKLVAGKIQVAHHTSMAASGVSAAGQNTLKVTLGGTGVTANQYAGGFLNIEKDDGIGYIYRVKSHPAANAAATCLFTLEENLEVATADTNTKVTAIHDVFANVNIAAVTAASRCIGATTCIVPASHYFWAQVSGPASLTVHTTATTIGQAVVRSDGEAGAIEGHVDTSDGFEVVGVAMDTCAAAESAPVLLTIE